MTEIVDRGAVIAVLDMMPIHPGSGETLLAYEIADYYDHSRSVRPGVPVPVFGRPEPLAVEIAVSCHREIALWLLEQCPFAVHDPTCRCDAGQMAALIRTRADEIEESGRG